MTAPLKLPTSWAVARLDEVCAINGRAFSLIDAASDLPVTFVPMAAVAEEFGGIDVSTARSVAEVAKGYSSFVEDDVLFAKITPCMENGKAAVVPKLATHIGFGSTEFHVLRSTGAVDPKWLGYFVSQLEFRKAARQDMTGSAGQLRVQSEWLRTSRIPLAPLSEQRRIVLRIDELLSDIDSATIELVAATRKLSLYRKSLLNSAIGGSLSIASRAVADRLLTACGPIPHGWKWVPIDQCCRVVSGYAFSSNSFIAEGAPVAKIANVGHGFYVDDADADHLDRSFEVSHADFLVESGDVLIALTRPITKDSLKSCRYPMGRSRALLNQRVAALRPLDSSLSTYIFYLTRSPYFRDCMAAAATQTLQPNVSAVALRRFLVPLPPVEEAVLISDHLDREMASIERVEEEVERVRVASTAQRQNILRAAFAGQLVPQDPADEPASVLLARIRAERESQAAPARPRRLRKTREAA